jgi:hypothetical protein
MWAAIDDGKELAVDMKDADFASVDGDDLACTRRNFIHRSNNMPARHGQSSP